MLPRDFVYVGEPIPKIKPSKHSEFISNLNKALLSGLVERKLITAPQMDAVMVELERQNYKK